jgi:hypothetical protein
MCTICIMLPFCCYIKYAKATVEKYFILPKRQNWASMHMDSSVFRNCTHGNGMNGVQCLHALSHRESV